MKRDPVAKDQSRPKEGAKVKQMPAKKFEDGLLVTFILPEVFPFVAPARLFTDSTWSQCESRGALIPGKCERHSMPIR